MRPLNRLATLVIVALIISKIQEYAFVHPRNARTRLSKGGGGYVHDPYLNSDTFWEDSASGESDLDYDLEIEHLPEHRELVHELLERIH